MMPPPGVPRPDAAARARARRARSRRRSIARRARAPNPGRPLVHRLNRAEYANAIRDLLALDVDVASLLPPDDSSVRLRQHRRRARRLAGAARELPDARPSASARWRSAIPSTPPVGELYPRPAGRVAGPARRGAAARHGRRHARSSRTLPLDGEYQFQVRLFRTNLGAMRGLEYPHQLEITRGRRARAPGVVRRRQGDRGVERQPDDDRRRRRRAASRVRVPLKAGPHDDRASRSSRRRTALNTRRLQTYVRSSADTIDFSGCPHIDAVHRHRAVQRRPGPGDTPSRRRIFVVPAGRRRRRGARARGGSCRRWRGAPIAATSTDGDIAALLDVLPARARSDGGTLRRAASSWRCGGCWPARSSSSASSAIRPAWRRAASTALSDLELASRLSFFLWSSIPDDELLDAGARRARCSTPAVLERQVRRMLADPKAQALVDNFAGPVAAAAQPAEQAARTRTSSPTSTTTCGRRSQTRDRAVLREHHARGPQRPRPDDGRLHVRQRAAGQALRHPERLRQPLPPRHAAPTRRGGACSARARS